MICEEGTACSSGCGSGRAGCDSAASSQGRTSEADRPAGPMTAFASMQSDEGPASIVSVMSACAIPTKSAALPMDKTPIDKMVCAINSNYFLILESSSKTRNPTILLVLGFDVFIKSCYPQMK